jgi:negative regulator of replication initiation
MERRINKKVESYVQQLKTDIKSWMDKSEMSTNSQYSEFLQFMYDYPNLSIDKEDFQKRKRVKNMVPHFDRCNAYRANNEQCTRRKQQGSEYCGTHIKGTPHGIINNETQNNKQNKIEVFVQEIKGINYYIDKCNNVYNTEDIISNSKNPSIIAKYVKNNFGEYSIPMLGL